MNLLPWPKEITFCPGAFRINRNTCIVTDAHWGRKGHDSAMLLQREISRVSFLKPDIAVAANQEPSNKICLVKRDTTPYAYTLDVSAEGIEIAAGTDSGLFYGAQTLRQIIVSEGLRIPALRVRDYPDFENRGFMHDVTRGKVPTLDTLKGLADRMAYYKLNQMQLYIEHTFAFQSMTEVWRDADPLTADEILELDAYCKTRYIELVPTIATFGHLYELLRTKTWRHLCELEIDDNEPYTWPDRQLHHTLDVSNAESLGLVCGMLDEFLPLFSSGKANICCDETFDLGEGKNRELAQKVGKGRLYLDFFLKVASHAKRLGKTVMFWDDVLLDHPEYLKEIPGDIICLTWDYAANVREEKIRKIHDTGLQQYVCPGVSAWNRLAADMRIATANITGSAALAKKHEATGLLTTDWGDYGHINLLSASLPGMILGGCAAWNCDEVPMPADFDRMASILEYGDRSGEVVSLQRELGGLCRMDWAQLVAWYCDKFLGRRFEYPNTDSLGSIGEEDILSCCRRAEEIEQEFVELSASTPRAARQDLEEMATAASGISLLNRLLLVIKKVDLQQDVHDLPDGPSGLARAIELWLESYSRLWRARNKESELGRIRAMLISVCDYLRGVE